MNECPVKITIQRQVNESGEPNNYLTVLFQGDLCYQVGDIQARRITHDEKENIQSAFIADSKLKPSTLYRKKIADIEKRSFAGGNRTVAGRSLKSFQNISSKTAISPDSLKSLVQRVIELQKELIYLDKKQFDNKKRKLYGYIYYPFIPHSRISITLTDESLVKFYHFVSQNDPLFFDASGSFVSPLPWLRNEKGETKGILLYALTARLPSDGSTPNAILEHLTSEHNEFSIREPLMKLKEMEQKFSENLIVDQNLSPSTITKH